MGSKYCECDPSMRIKYFRLVVVIGVMGYIAVTFVNANYFSWGSDQYNDFCQTKIQPGSVNLFQIPLNQMMLPPIL